MASNKTTQTGEKKASSRRKSPAKSAPADNAVTAGAGRPEGTVVAQTSDATIPENPASTTSAADPGRDSTVPEVNTATAQVQGVASDDAGTAPGLTEQALGERHSHPAETTAERNLRTAGLSGTVDEIPAGADADPAKNPSPTEDDVRDDGSRHDESGALQEATRRAIGAGYGAPDGIGDDEVAAPAGAEPADDIEPVVLENGITFRGNKAKLWRMLEKGATHEEMLEATKYTSAIGTIHVMAEQAGRSIDTEKDKKSGVRTYKLASAKK